MRSRTPRDLILRSTFHRSPLAPRPVPRHRPPIRKLVGFAVLRYYFSPNVLQDILS